MTAAAAIVQPMQKLAEKKALMREAFAGQSRFQREFKADATELDCATFAPLLRKQILRILMSKGIEAREPLERLHETVSAEMRAYNFNDGVNKISALLYDTDEAFAALYHRFIRECVAKHFAWPFYFQATPTIRLHCPDGENSGHYPRYHTDIGYGHPPQEINIWIPLTEPSPPQHHGFRRMDVAASRSILSEFDYDFAPFIERAVGDKGFNRALNAFAPQVETKQGKMHAFDSRCIHTGEPLEMHTAASIDIRIIAVEDFAPLPVAYQGSGGRRMLYKPGEAYHSLSSDQL